MAAPSPQLIKKALPLLKNQGPLVRLRETMDAALHEVEASRR